MPVDKQELTELVESAILISQLHDELTALTPSDLGLYESIEWRHGDGMKLLEVLTEWFGVQMSDVARFMPMFKLRPNTIETNIRTPDDTTLYIQITPDQKLVFLVGPPGRQF